MTSAPNESCEVCMNTYNDSKRKAVALPCGHDFCLTCLVRLKTAGDHKCPKCLGDWEELDVQALPGMALGAKAHGEEEWDLLEELRKGDYWCTKHDFAYDFRSRKEKEMYCKKCVIVLGLSASELELVDDAVPMIKADIGDRVVKANEQLEVDSKVISDFHDDCSKELLCVSDISEKFQRLEEKLKKFIAIAEKLQAKRLSDSVLALKVDDETEKIQSEAEIGLMMSSIEALDSLTQPCVLPVFQKSETLLCSIASTYTENKGTDELPSSAAFISGLMKATGNWALPLTEAALDADMLKEGEVWTVDNTNCLAALLAMTDRQPRRLRLIFRYNEPETPLAAAVAAVTKAARGCEVWLEFHHSFFRPEHQSTDQELFEHILANSSLRFTRFMGHLDAAGIAKLPTTVVNLGLAIGSAADATTVSGLKPWDKLRAFNVSVSSDVATCDLSQLPSVRDLRLYFPDLTDARVDSVRPAIEALVPDMKLQVLVFPRSQLTAATTRRLAQQLRGARIDDVIIQLRGPWRPEQAEKERVKAELRSAVGCSIVCWNMV